VGHTNISIDDKRQKKLISVHLLTTAQIDGYTNLYGEKMVTELGLFTSTQII
jgi:hypothetical protein